MELTGPKLNLAFGSDNGQWVVQNPKDMRADTSKFEGVYRKAQVGNHGPATRTQT